MSQHNILTWKNSHKLFLCSWRGSNLIPTSRLGNAPQIHSFQRQADWFSEGGKNGLSSFWTITQFYFWAGEPEDPPKCLQNRLWECLQNQNIRFRLGDFVHLDTPSRFSVLVFRDLLAEEFPSLNKLSVSDQGFLLLYTRTELMVAKGSFIFGPNSYFGLICWCFFFFIDV